jgi:hypothetical protein
MRSVFLFAAFLGVGCSSESTTDTCASCSSECDRCGSGDETTGPLVSTGGGAASGTTSVGTSSSAASGGAGAGGSTAPSFRSEFTRGAYPACGFDGSWNAQEGVYYDSQVVEGEGPDGLGFLRTTYRAGVDFSDNPQHALGVGNQGLHAAVTQGMALFVRSRVRWTNAWTADGQGYGGKHLMIGNAGANEHVSRVILGVRDNGTTSASLAYQLTRNIDGAQHGTSLIEVTKDEFHSVQLYIKSSSISVEIGGITRSGSTATVTTNGPHGFVDGMLVEIRGEIDQWEYEGVYPVTVTGPDTFTYAVEGAPASPATGQAFFAMTADAELRLWIDGDNANGFDAPSDRSPTSSFGLSVIAWGAEVRYGGFNSQSGSTFYSPPIQLDLGTFEIGDAFDAGWGTP